MKRDKKLGVRGIAIFDAAEIVISAISIAEMYYADKKSKLFDNFAETYAEIKSKPYVRIVEFLADDVLEFDDLSAIPEMHDRIIVGLAKRLGAPLITAGEKIIAAGLVPTVQIVW